MRSSNTESSHVDHIVLDYGHTGCLSTVAAVLLHERLAVTVVYLNYDREYTWYNVLNEVNIPFFKSLSHNSVVSVSEGLCNDVPSLVPAVSAVIEENTHKLRDSKCRVSIVDVDSNLFSEVFECAVNHHVVVYDIADRSCTEEVLLSETEALTLKVVIVRIEYL